MRIAIVNGSEGFTALVLADNRRMLRLFCNTGYLVRSRYEENAWEITLRFDERAEKAEAAT